MSEQVVRIDESFEKLRLTALKVKSDRDALLKSLKAIMKRIESGDLVRDISKDAASSDWAVQMMYFIRELSEANVAIINAESER